MSYFQQIHVVDKGPQGQQDRDKDKCPQDPQGQAYIGTEINTKNTEVRIDFARYLAKNHQKKPNVVPINEMAYRRIYNNYFGQDRRYVDIMEQIGGGEPYYPGCNNEY